MFIGEQNFILKRGFKGNGGAYSNFVNPVGTYVPVITENNNTREGMDLNNRPYNPETDPHNNLGLDFAKSGSGGGNTNNQYEALVPMFPDFSKMSCIDLANQIDNMKQTLAAPSLVARDASWIIAYQKAIASATATYQTGCQHIPGAIGATNNLPGDAEAMLPTDKGTITTPDTATSVGALKNIPWLWVVLGGTGIILTVAGLASSNK